MPLFTDLSELQLRPYFTCTLGEAEILNKTLLPAPYNTINGFLDYLAQKFPNDVAVGSVRPRNQQSNSSGNDWIVEALSFAELQSLSKILSTHLVGRDHGGNAQNTVALYASSSLAYLIHLFAWLRCGYKVVLISTACNSNAIKHLLKACGATAICCDSKHEKIVDEALAVEKDHIVSPVLKIELEYVSLDDIRQLKAFSTEIIPIPTQDAADVVLYGHSSGTSTGLPKPIPITHQDEIGALPRYHQMKNHRRPDSTFSTTPIYTGGLADLWRSWSAGTALWTYAENEIPVTAENIVRYRSAAETWIAEHQENASPIGYISCVPFVTQLMAEQPDLLEWLQSMKMVGVGGAAMPSALGGMLVNNGVNLVSRFGSRECGFLLSSDREYSNDKEWQYLRHDFRVSSIAFKKWNDTDYELFVEQTWPSRSPVIRSKQPFNSHDLFIAHSSIKNAWKYNGRSDVQITLTTGKKFDPAGIETALGASEWIKDAVIVGNDRPVPAGVIFVSTRAESLDGEECREKVLEAVSEVNRSCPAHARLRNNMIAILSSDQASLIQKSSKGTIMRGKFAEDFADTIQQLYSEDQEHLTGPMLDTLNEEELIQEISSIITKESGLIFGKTSPGFYQAGIDSTVSLQIRNQIRARLSTSSRGKIPLNVVYNTGNVQALADLVQGLKGNNIDNSRDSEVADSSVRRLEIDDLLKRVRIDSIQEHQTLDTYSKTDNTDTNTLPTGQTVLLTGATGFLGAHLLIELVGNESIRHIICLVRQIPKEKSQIEARDRVIESLSSYGLRISRNNETKVSYVYSSLDQPDLGLEPDFIQHTLSQVTRFVHAAWAVNFSLPLKAFDTQLHGLLNLYNLAKRSAVKGQHAKFVFISSTASILEGVSPISEILSQNYEDCSGSGYGKSKWAAERLLAELADQSGEPEIFILRVGQLTANSVTGAWNLREAWPLMLDAGFNVIPHQDGKVVLPDLSEINGNRLDWLPVDLSAKAVTELALDDQGQNPNRHPGVFHVLYNSASVQTWADVNSWLSAPVTINSQQGTQDIEIKFISPDRWLDLLEAEGEAGTQHPALSLVSLWRNGWTPVSGSRTVQKFSTLHSESRSKTMKRVNSSNGNMNREAFLKMLKWLLLQSHVGDGLKL